MGYTEPPRYIESMADVQKAVRQMHRQPYLDKHGDPMPELPDIAEFEITQQDLDDAGDDGVQIQVRSHEPTGLYSMPTPPAPLPPKPRLMHKRRQKSNARRKPTAGAFGSPKR